MNARIALVIGQLGYGGAERQVSLLARGLADAGWPVTVFCLSEQLEPFGAELIEAGVPLRPLQRKGHYDLGRAFKLASLIREEKIELIHSHLEIADIYSYLALARAGRPRFVPTVLSMPVRENPLRHFFSQRALAAGELIHANCLAAASAYAKHYSIDESKFRTVYNGVLPLPARTSSSYHESRLSLNIPRSSLVVGTISKDAPDKNLPAFFRLIAALLPHVKELKAVVAGSGLAEAYASRVKEAWNVRQVTLFLGEQKNIQTLLAALDLFVLTSIREGLPNVVLEAMATGLPVVAYDTGGVSELLADGRSGVVVPCGAEESLFRAVSSLLADPDRRNLMGEAAHRRVFEQFNLEKMIEGTIELYKEVLMKCGK